MYLKEVNGLTCDPSLMSTSELKENYARFSHAKSIMGESLSSGSTPFSRIAGGGGGPSSEGGPFRVIDTNTLNVQRL